MKTKPCPSCGEPMSVDTDRHQRKGSQFYCPTQDDINERSNSIARALVAAKERKARLIKEAHYGSN